jgi:AraC-like DNA-binding protein
MEAGFRHYTPQWPLTDYVVGFWSYGHYSQPHAFEHVMPTGTMSLVLHIDATEHATATLSGTHSKCFQLNTSAPFSVIAASFRPGGEWPFFGLPADELTNLSVPLDALLGPEAFGLRDRLLEAQASLVRFQILERFLLDRLEEHSGRSAAVHYALQVFHGAEQVPRVANVAEQIGYSATKLIAVFRREVGLAPKAYSRLSRFRRVLVTLAQGQDVDWSETALACGYYDQPHLIHDFKEFSGLTPSEYLLERVSVNHVRSR